MRFNNNKNKGFTLVEVVVTMSLFAIFIATRLVIDNNTLNAYVDARKTNELELLTNDLYAYLYSYKKTYGTSDFIQLITQGDLDNNCNGNDFNGNSNLTDQIDEYCFIYPYLDGNDLKFYNGIVNDNNANLNNVYLLDNNTGGYDGLSYRAIFGQSSNLITIGLKEDFSNSDKYSGYIGIYNPSMLKYIYKQNVFFE